MIKKLGILALLLLLSLSLVVVFAACGKSEKESWDVSENGDGSVTARLYKEGSHYTLTISGNGAMKNWNSHASSYTPWNTPYSGKITAVTVENGVTNIGDWAFQGFYKLTSVTIAESVTSIGEYAFGECRALTSIKLPDGVKRIGKNAFERCSELTSVQFSDSVTSIALQAFYNCDKLQYNEYDNGKYLGNAENPHLALIGIADRSITSCKIHENAKVIADDAFDNDGSCGQLTSIVIPNGITHIGNSAFEECYSLVSVVIPAGVRHIGYHAFDDCNALESVVFQNTVGWHTIHDGTDTDMNVTDASTNAKNLKGSYRFGAWENDG